MFSKFKALFSGKSAQQEMNKEPEIKKTSGQDKAGQEEISLKGKKEIMDRRISEEPARNIQKDPDKDPVQSLQKEETAPEKASRERKTNGDQRNRRSPERRDEGRDLYRFLNQAVKSMHFAYSQGNFAELENLGRIPANVVEKYETIRGSLSEDSAAYLSALRTLIIPRKEEDAVYADIADGEVLKKEFLHSMLPFYASYAPVLFEGRLRYSSLIGNDLLKLFHELTGKRFSMGFHRRYEGGSNAFEWEGDRYQVYDKKGHMLCDATFADGAAVTGYIESAEPDPDHEGWDIVKAGQWKDGEFISGSLKYVYRMPVE